MKNQLMHHSTNK